MSFKPGKVTLGFIPANRGFCNTGGLYSDLVTTAATSEGHGNSRPANDPKAPPIED